VTVGPVRNEITLAGMLNSASVFSIIPPIWLISRIEGTESSPPSKISIEGSPFSRLTRATPRFSIRAGPGFKFFLNASGKRVAGAGARGGEGLAAEVFFCAVSRIDPDEAETVLAGECAGVDSRPGSDSPSRAGNARRRIFSNENPKPYQENTRTIPASSTPRPSGAITWLRR
jgi:hypothetical protein